MKTREIKIKDKVIGGENPILIQSMCNTQTKNARATIHQIRDLEEAGCEIVRVSVPDMDSAKALKEIHDNISIPLVADIHFDYRLAIEAAPYVDKLRINPGNIGDNRKVKAVVDCAKEHNLPIRIGVNLGSIEKDLERDYGLTAEAMIRSADRHIAILEEHNFENIVVSLKTSSIPKMIEANRLFAKKYDYPLHIGVTEAGSLYTGTIRNAVGIGILLAEGIGSTLRVSLAGDPVEEIRAGWEIVKSLGLRQRGIEVIACPTCARAGVDVAQIATQIEEETKQIAKNIRIAIMGCMVNGPGEAKEVNIGIVGAKDCAFVYLNGEQAKKIDKKDVISTILDFVEQQ